MIPNPNDTIVALATPPGRGAIGVIRISGEDAFSIMSMHFNSKDLSTVDTHTIHYGWFRRKTGEIIDEVLVSVFKSPRSYTRQNVVEISSHGNPFIINQIIEALTLSGARLAEPGEFTLRAFLNGSIDLTQAEAIAELISTHSEPGRKLAVNHLRKGFATRLKILRGELLNLASLIELELDFSEEDVEFADRKHIRKILNDILNEISTLIDSFKTGNAYKNGILTVIAGKPNAGKSTLMNLLLNENKAIVSDIPGTTRDIIEDRLSIGGYEFLLMDTAGVRQSEDKIEKEGIRRTLEKIESAQLILYIYDLLTESPESALEYTDSLKISLKLPSDIHIIRIANKIDLFSPEDVEIIENKTDSFGGITISACEGLNIEFLTQKMIAIAESFTQYDTIVSNQRHVAALRNSSEAIQKVILALDENRSGELLALDLRIALDNLGEITGEITNDEILGNIFSKFCIGK